MQENCLQRISLCLFCYSVPTGLRPGFINLSNGRMRCGMSAQLSLPRRGQRRCGRRIWASYTSHSWELGLITPEWSNTELWCEGTGQLLIYGAQDYCQGITLSSLSVFPSMGSLPIPAAQRHVLSNSRAVLGHFCSHKPHTEHQTQPLLTPRDCSKGSFPSIFPLLQFSV